MTPTQAKFIAPQAGCEIVWVREWQVWALRRKTATDTEGSGGMFISSGQLRSLTFDQFTGFVTAAANGPREAGE